MRSNECALSSIETEMMFLQWCNQRGIEMILFDGDDTLWKTREIFGRFIAECSLYLSQVAPYLGVEVWKKEINQASDKLYETVSVNPNRWRQALAIVADGTLHPSYQERATEILMQIYQISPVFLPETESTLEFLNKVGMPWGIVTHANSEWTRNKYTWLNLQRFTSWDNIFVIGEDDHKTPQQWFNAIQYFVQIPSQCMIVGDSPRSDIEPTHILGGRHHILVKHGEIWVTQNATMTKDVMEMPNIGGIPMLGANAFFEHTL